jgi:hypothetical protein
MERGQLRLLPRASHPAVTHDALRGGDRPSRTDPSTAPSTSVEPPNGASHFHSCTLTSHPAVGCFQHHLGIGASLLDLQLQRDRIVDAIRTAQSCSPDSDWRTITDRCRCRSIPTNCLPSYSSIGASRDSWKVSTPSIRRELHQDPRPRPFIASSGLGDLAMCPSGVFAVDGVVA